jgi:tetratricopeptide (TPR) repeat protein
MVLSLVGCHHTVYSVAPSVPPVESGIDLQLDTQTRLLQEAYRAYVQGRYTKASILFKRFVESNPQSPRLTEARWWLARSYEAQGNVPAAVAEYRALAEASVPSNDAAASYQAHAIRRLDDFMQIGGADVLSGVRPVVLSMTHADWNRIADLSAWLAQVHKAGVTTLLVDAGASVGDPEQSHATGVYFKTSTVRVIDDFLGRVIPLAHAEGVAVFARLDLHQAAWMSPKPDWASAVPSPSSTTPQSSGLVDVLHPEYQQAVSRMMDDLCRTGIDGLVLQARMRKGFAGEISPISRAVFETKFGQSAEGDPASPLFWRWGGWKARSYLRFAEQLKDQARRERSTRVVAVTVHASAVLDPKAALMDYGEDVLESRLRGFEVVVLPESGASNGAESGRTDLIKRLIPMMQGERPLWLGTSLTLSDPEMIPAAITATLTAMSEQPAIPLVLMNEAIVP